MFKIFLLRKNDGPSGGGQPAGDPPPAPNAGDGGTPTSGAEPRANPQEPPAQPGQGDPPKNQPQAQPYAVFPTPKALDERLDRARQEGMSQLLQELGIEDPKALKSMVDVAREAEEANKTELEKLQGKLEKAATDAQSIQAERDQLAAQLRREREDRLVERLANSLGFADASDASLLVNREAFEYGDDEQIKEASVKAALEKLLEAKPHLRGQAAPAPRIDAQAGTGKGPAEPAKKDYGKLLPSSLRRGAQQVQQ